MGREKVHYEVFVRRQASSGWSLDLATEDRARALEAAEQLLEDGHAAAVKVSKELMDPETNEFRSVTIFNKGAPERAIAKKKKEGYEPLCVSPSDLYTFHARDRIGRLLDGWLQRSRATPFELLHRADLVEKLEASGTELQHAIQKIAIPEAQGRGVGVHEVIRAFQGLVQRAIDRLLTDARKGKLPNLEKEGFAEATERLMADPERGYMLGAAVAGHIGDALTWNDKVMRILDLADAAPQSPQARAFAFQVLEQPLSEILGARSGLAELLGHDLELGETLAAMTRLAGADQVEALIGIEPSVARAMPALKGPAARLSNWLGGPYFESCRVAIAHRVLKELTGPRRLKPGDAEGEIELLRALAMALTAAGGRILTSEDIQAAFSTRSKMLVTGDFVEALLGDDLNPRQEVEALIRLTENVTGAANKRQAARWVAANVAALRFEKEMRGGPDSPSNRLAQLASLQRAIARCSLAPEDCEPIQNKLGEIGGMVEADARLITALVRAPAPAVTRLTMLLRLAVGEAAPLGPAADRARAEAMKLLRTQELRSELQSRPEDVERVRDLMQTAGLAA